MRYTEYACLLLKWEKKSKIKLFKCLMKQDSLLTDWTPPQRETTFSSSFPMQCFQFALPGLLPGLGHTSSLSCLLHVIFFCKCIWYKAFLMRSRTRLPNNLLPPQILHVKTALLHGHQLYQKCWRFLLIFQLLINIGYHIKYERVK